MSSLKADKGTAVKMNPLPALAGLLAATLPSIGAAQATPTTTDAQPPGNARSGKDLYVRYGCHECHGTTGQGGSQFGPKIAPNPLPFTAYYDQLRRPRAFMPMYTHKVLSDQQLSDIYAYLLSVPPAKNYKTIPELNPPRR